MAEEKTSDDWDFFAKRARRTTQALPALTEPCETATKAMWTMELRITELAKAEGKQLPPKDTFVLTHFRRNNVYLLSSYVLAAMGFVWPSMNLQRTAYETILRSYLFVVKPEEADLYYQNLGTTSVKTFLKSRKYYSHSYLSQKLYKAKTQKVEKKLYGLLCTSAHAEIQGLLLDFPAQNQKEIEDRLRILLMLDYLNIQVFAETFLDRFDKDLSEITKDTLKNIASAVGNQIPVLEPDKEVYKDKILLKKGNFVAVL